MIQRILMTSADGRQIAPSYYVDTGGDADDWRDELLQWTTAGASSERRTDVLPLAHVGSSDTYQGVLTVCQLIFTNSSAGGRCAVLIPAPVESMFLGDGETFNPTAAASLVAVATATLRLPSGNLADTFLTGHRRTLQPSR